MESARVKRLASDWTGKVLNGWRVGDYVNSGKSALVFKASNTKIEGAIKIFDPELVERFGKGDELERIRRELKLVGAPHENLVTIFDGGYSDQFALCFVVMEYIDAPNLASVLKDVPITQVRPLISQVAQAARYLESLDLVHRDIKPDNIAVFPDFKRAKLLDLGVIRPLNAESGPPLTDREEQVFIGTHQYGSPEFVLRQERQNPEGFRALTFYQLGAVLHDMLERRRIFADSASPIARLVQAVLHDKPRIDPTGKPADLVNLANNCLVKDPLVRLEIVRWDDFTADVNVLDAASAAKEAIRKRRARALYELGSMESDSAAQHKRKRKQLLEEFLSRLAEQLRGTSGENELPPIIVKEIVDEDAKHAVLFTHYKASARYGLPVDYYFVARLTLIDVGANVVRLECAAAASAESLKEGYFEPHYSKVFNGVYDDAIMRSALERALFPTFEHAMDLSANIGTVLIPMSKVGASA
jgi:serine/threonine protein kinase